MFVNPINVYSPKYLSVTRVKQNATMPNYNLTFTGEDRFDFNKKYEEELDKRNWFQKKLGLGKEKAFHTASTYLVGYNEGKEEQEKIYERLVEQQQQTLKELSEKLKMQVKLEEEIRQKYEEAKLRNQDQQIILSLKKELEEIKQNLKEQKEKYNMTADSYNKLVNQQKIITKRENNKGWEKIAGNDLLKSQMEEVFINKLPLEAGGYSTTIPNGLLFYGQHGTGKTRFAQALAEQAGCEYVTIDTMQPDEDLILDLRKELRNAQRRYENSDEHKRTIILLDDFDSVAELNDEEREKLKNGKIEFSDTNIGQLASLLNGCSDKYHATVIMTTNNPKKVDSQLLDEDVVPYQIFLGPPNEVDAAKIFKYHTSGFTDQEIDYNKLANEVLKVVDDNQAYSAQGIVNVVEAAKNIAKGAQITEDDLMEALKTAAPDISAETFNKFLSEMEDLIERRSQINKGE